MRNKYLSLVIVPDGGGRTFRGRLSYPKLVILFSSLLVLIGLIAYLSLQYGRISLQALRGIEAIERVESLEAELGKIETLERDVKELKKVKDQIEGMLGVIHNPSSIPQEMKGTELPSIWPVKGNVTRTFSREHPGIDIAVPEGSAIWAAADGVVVKVGWDEELGFMIEIEHEEGLKTVYGHNSQILVEKENKVKRGDVIAFSGSSGRSTAPHLHYEIVLNGMNMDPMKYLRKEK